MTWSCMLSEQPCQQDPCDEAIYKHSTCNLKAAFHGLDPANSTKALKNVVLVAVADMRK